MCDSRKRSIVGEGGYRQLDNIWSHQHFWQIPQEVPGRLMTTDFIFFKWCGDIDPSRYTVVVESLDTAGDTYRSIGKLNNQMLLPHVYFGWHARIGVLPDSNDLPSFESELSRGCTYILPNTRGKNGRFQMEMVGVSRPPGN